MSATVKIVCAIGIVVLSLVYVIKSRAAFESGYDEDVERDQGDFNKQRYVLGRGAEDRALLQRLHKEDVSGRITVATTAAAAAASSGSDPTHPQQQAPSPPPPVLSPRAAAAPHASTASPSSTTFWRDESVTLETPCADDAPPVLSVPRILPPCTLRNGVKLPANHHEAAKVHLPKYSIVNFMRLHRNATAPQLLDAASPMPCVLMLLHTGVCREFEESFVACVKRVGVVNVERIVPLRCIESAFWRSFSTQLVEDRRQFPDRFPKPDPDPELWRRLPRGVIPDATMWIAHNGTQPVREYVPSEKRTVGQFGAPVTCAGNGAVVHPFGFGIPGANIVRSLPLYKAFDWMPITPPRHLGPRGWGTAKIAEEQLFQMLYSSSFFAFTNNRGGVDCQRHTEILAGGAVPHFADLPVVGKHRVTHLPRSEILDAMRMPGVAHVGAVEHTTGGYNGIRGDHPFFQKIGPEHLHFTNPGRIDAAKFDVADYQRRAERIHSFTQRHLSCGAMVAGMLRIMGYENPKHVLLVTRFEYDYMALTIQNGFSELGIRMTVVGEDSSSYFYRQRVDSEAAGENPQPEAERGARLYHRAKALYGGGFAFAGRGYNQDEYVVSRGSSELIKRILAREFDLAVYTYAYPHGHDRVPYIGELPTVLNKSQLAFVDHNDWSHESKTQMFAWQSARGFVFTREMPDDPCRG